MTIRTVHFPGLSHSWYTSHNRATWGWSNLRYKEISSANRSWRSVDSGSPASSTRRLLTATKCPVLLWRASTTGPLRPVPKTRGGLTNSYTSWNGRLRNRAQGIPRCSVVPHRREPKKSQDPRRGRSAGWAAMDRVRGPDHGCGQAHGAGRGWGGSSRARGLGARGGGRGPKPGLVRAGPFQAPRSKADRRSVTEHFSSFEVSSHRCERLAVVLPPSNAAFRSRVDVPFNHSSAASVDPSMPFLPCHRRWPHTT
mmetsp:Transcript_85240/g.227890  ORF Transcript_85240/g.227890 Transcript_85240/m.227890 type:complete len:254 (-) Transcript_85240:30-791(-)